ncbi:MAG: type 4a pilus biogenesis protein PilO [Phycisphaerae bacterium]|nr:type 4a pilus biogenesis protein PilO [Phycisphaerae bacterium]
MSSNSRKIVLFIIMLGLSGFAYIYMIKPANASIEQQKQQVNAKLAKLNELEKLSGQANDVGKQLSKLSEAIEFFRNKLPPENEIHKVLESITLIAQKQGLVPGTITALKTKDYNGYIEQPLKMELSGSFYAFYSFLTEAEKLPRIIRVREFELKKDDKNSSELKANVIISVFFST